MTYKTGSWGEQAKARSKRRNEYFKLYKKKRDPLKLKARRIVDYLIKKGVLIKKNCKKCGIGGRIEAHHTDYSKPLKIVWLCPKHHREADKKLGFRK